eukprot:1503558-Pyramimonas_sp.AAC.1
MGEPDDFGATAGASADPAKKRSATNAEEEPTRKWLKSFETVPCQLLNAYGASRFPKMSDDQVWAAMGAPLRSGAVCAAERTSPTSAAAWGSTDGCTQRWSSRSTRRTRPSNSRMSSS